MALGMMSSVSLDGIDLAVIRTDGDLFVEAGPTLRVSYSRELKIYIRRAIKSALEGREGAADIGKAAGEITLAHVRAVENFLENKQIKRTDIDIVGFHGHTILHRPAADAESLGTSWQIGDGITLAEETRIDVIGNFRAGDMAAGGRGTPLTPIYYRALVSSMSDRPGCPVGIITFDGVSKITYVPEDTGAGNLLAFECGPGDALLNEWLKFKTGEPIDRHGKIVEAGTVNEEALRMMLLHPYLRLSPPKSLDRYVFTLDQILKLTPEDGAATLAAFMAECIVRSEKFLPELPGGYVVCGEGRCNSALMQVLQSRLDAEVVPAETAGWRGDDLEAECIAYLAVRSLKKLPLTYPGTTRVAAPTKGGVFHKAPR